MAFSFGPLLPKTAPRLFKGHMVTDATPVSGKEFPDAETCCCPAGEVRPKVQCLPRPWSRNWRLTQPAQALGGRAGCVGPGNQVMIQRPAFHSGGMAGARRSQEREQSSHPRLPCLAAPLGVLCPASRSQPFLEHSSHACPQPHSPGFDFPSAPRSLAPSFSRSHIVLSVE